MNHQDLLERLESLLNNHRIHVLRIERDIEELYESLLSLQNEFDRIKERWNQK